MSYYGPGTDVLCSEMLTPKQERSLFKRFYAGDLEARDKIVTHYLKLVAKMSILYSKGMLTEEDAISAGNYALMALLTSKRFKPGRGTQFGSYLRYYIRGEVLYAIHHPSQRLLAMDSAEDPMKILLELPDNSAPIDKTYEERQLNECRRAKILQAIRTLPKLERLAIIGVGLKQKNHREVGKEAGHSRQASHQAYERGIAKLRRFLSTETYKEIRL